MSTISRQTLSLAIFSMVINRCRLQDRIERVSLEVDDEEHLSETVLDMDKALGELADLYDTVRRTEGGQVRLQSTICQCGRGIPARLSGA